MNILHIDTGREMRGGQWQTFYLIRGLLRKGSRIRLLSFAGSPLFEAARAQDMEVQPLGLRNLLESRGFDVVHAHDARAHTLGLLCRRPLIVSRRVAFPVRRSFVSRWKYRRAGHYIAVSEYVKTTLLAAGVPADRISVVYDGVPLGLVPLGRENRSTVLALDSVDPGKGKAIIESAAELAGVPVHFSGNLTRDLAEAAVFVYISECEGLGSAALLAMAAGAPVIASRVGGLPEIVENEVSGLLTPNEATAIAARIQRLRNDRIFAMKLASAARTRVERRFSVERMVDETVRVYERVLS